MQEISFRTRNLKEVTDAIQGRWDRHSEKDVVWALCGRVAIVEGNYEKFPLNVVMWHHVGSLHIAILGTEKLDGTSESGSEVVSDVAKSLETARKLKVNLGNDSKDQLFDGSEDATDIGVDGTLDDSHVAGASRWNSHIIDSSNPHEVTAHQVGAYTKEESYSRFAGKEDFEDHRNSTDNPHEVTAEQVGSFSKDETDSRIAEAVSGLVGGWLGNKTVDEINLLSPDLMKTGDHVTVKGEGVVENGNIDVRTGDDLYWVMPRKTWELKVVSDKGLVVDGELLTFN